MSASLCEFPSRVLGIDEFVEFRDHKVVASIKSESVLIAKKGYSGFLFVSSDVDNRFKFHRAPPVSIAIIP